MYSCVFGSEFINLVGFFGCHCLTPVSPFTLYEVKAAQKHSRRSGPCLLYLITIMIFNLSCFSLMRRRRGVLLEVRYHAVL